jgi:hypothetical protein
MEEVPSAQKLLVEWLPVHTAAKCYLRIKINAYVSVGPIFFVEKPYQDLDFSKTENNPVRCPDEDGSRMEDIFVKSVKKAM